MVNRRNCWIGSGIQSLIDVSFTSSPLGLNAMAVTSAKMSIVSCSADDSIQFQILIDLSHEPDTSVVDAKVGENCNEVTGP